MKIRIFGESHAPEIGVEIEGTRLVLEALVASRAAHYASFQNHVEMV